MRGVCLLILTLSLLPASARAATVDEIIAMSKAGVSEPVILTYIARDKTIFTIDADTLVKLKTANVSEAVVIAMLKSGRTEADAALRADEAARLQNDMASAPVGPASINIGHGPERPNAEPFDDYPAMPALRYGPDYSPAPYAVPYGAAYGSAFVPQYVPPFAASAHHVTRRGARPAVATAVCLPPTTSRSAVAACAPALARPSVR